MNNVCLMGRLTRDPELKTTNSGKEVCNFSVAVNRRYKPQDGQEADFIDCQCWGGTAVFVEKYFQKGKMIAVQGEMQTRKYQDRNGNNRVAVYVNVNAVDFCGGKSEDGGSGQAAPTAYSAPAPAPSAASSLDVAMDDDDELPF